MANGISSLRYLDPQSARIAGQTCEDLELRTAEGRRLGRVQGFVIDPQHRRVCYFVVRTGRLAPPRLVPVTAARVNRDERAIELLSGIDPLSLDRYSAHRFPACSDEDFLTAIFAARN